MRLGFHTGLVRHQCKLAACAGHVATCLSTGQSCMQQALVVAGPALTPCTSECPGGHPFAFLLPGGSPTILHWRRYSKKAPVPKSISVRSTHEDVRHSACGSPAHPFLRPECTVSQFHLFLIRVDDTCLRPRSNQQLIFSQSSCR